jgi:hypothetical protein
VVKDTTFTGEKKHFFSCFEGSQAVPNFSSGRGVFGRGVEALRSEEARRKELKLGVYCA